jgi:uncharacterized protein
MAHVLMTFGPIQFEVYPLNYHESDHTTASDYARKDIMESSPNREWVGEGDEEIVLRGRVFPYAVTMKSFQSVGTVATGIGLGAKSALDKLDAVRRAHHVDQLIEGGESEGRVLGWFVIERLIRHHTHIGAHGFGRVINFDASFMRVDTPDPTTYLGDIQRLTRA